MGCIPTTGQASHLDGEVIPIPTKDWRQSLRHYWFLFTGDHPLRQLWVAPQRLSKPVKSLHLDGEIYSDIDRTLETVTPTLMTPIEEGPPAPTAMGCIPTTGQASHLDGEIIPTPKSIGDSHPDTDGSS